MTNPYVVDEDIKGELDVIQKEKRGAGQSLSKWRWDFRRSSTTNRRDHREVTREKEWGKTHNSTSRSPVNKVEKSGVDGRGYRAEAAAAAAAGSPEFIKTRWLPFDQSGNEWNHGEKRWRCGREVRTNSDQKQIDRRRPFLVQWIVQCDLLSSSFLPSLDYSQSRRTRRSERRLLHCNAKLQVFSESLR